MKILESPLPYANRFYNFDGALCHLWSLTAVLDRKSSKNIQLNMSTPSSTEERKSYKFLNEGEHIMTDFFWKRKRSYYRNLDSLRYGNEYCVEISTLSMGKNSVFLFN